MANTDARHDGEDCAEHQPPEDGEEVTAPALILPPSQFETEEELRAPYANEMLLLAFEGKHKKFEVGYDAKGRTPSYAPPQSIIQVRETGLVHKLKRLWHKIFNEPK